MRYSNYKEFYDQTVTLPIPGLRGKKVDMKMVGTFASLLLICAVVISLVYTVFPIDRLTGVDRKYIILGLTALATFASLNVDTGNYPFLMFISSIVTFAYKKVIKKKAFVSFQEVDSPEKQKEYKWKIRYRDIVDEGDEICYRMYPLTGLVDRLAGIKFSVNGATKIKYIPFSKTLRINTGNFESLRPQEVTIRNILPTSLEVGRGKVAFLTKKGKVQASYEPTFDEGKERN